MSQRIGVVSIQGDFEKHLAHINKIGMIGTEVRDPIDLDRIDRLIIPGGESTTVGILMQRFGLGSAIQSKFTQGMPVWGTCMGMILMAQRVVDREQYCLSMLDITVQRNAFGAQVHSFESTVPIKNIAEPVNGLFIRAPIVVELSEKVEILGKFQDKIVAVRQGQALGTSFHPELTNDTSFLEFFCGI